MQILALKVKGCRDWCIWICSTLLDQGQGNTNLWIFSNSNELKGTWYILYSKLQLERK